MNLKELTWQNHQNAERQAFVKELMGGISDERYAIFLFNQHPQYNLLEQFAMLHDILDVRRAPAIWDDYKELWGDRTDTPPLLPVVNAYTEHLKTIMNDPDKLMAHIYVRHLGDLSGGQMIKRKVPGAGRLYTFDQAVDEMKATIKERCNDSMADEAKICFDFATTMFQEMMDIA